MPNIILEGIQATDRDDLELQERAAATAAAAPSSSIPASASAATVSFHQQDGRSGQVSFERPPVSSFALSEASETISPGGEGLPPPPPPLPEIKLDDETLLAVSRAIMGRLDIVDLVGRTTAYEAAERVRREEGLALLGVERAGRRPRSGWGGEGGGRRGIAWGGWGEAQSNLGWGGEGAALPDKVLPGSSQPHSLVLPAMSNVQEATGWNSPDLSRCFMSCRSVTPCWTRSPWSG